MVDVLEKFRIDGSVALVTGGGGLLGREFCKTLASAGAQVILADLDQERAADVLSALRDDQPDIEFAHLDVTDPEACIQLVTQTKEKFGKIDILVNSAAMDPKFDREHAQDRSDDFESYPLSSWREALEVNLTGMFVITQAVARSMVAVGKGSIINICSTYGLVGPDQRIYQQANKPRRYKPAYYSTTKAGVLGFTRYLASYYAGTRIRVNALTPGGVYADHDEEFVSAYSARTMMGRMAEKDEMNGALLFLASGASSYMTGANLIVDGGWTAW